MTFSAVFREIKAVINGEVRALIITSQNLHLETDHSFASDSQVDGINIRCTVSLLILKVLGSVSPQVQKIKSRS